MAPPRSKDDWKALIEPHLSESLRTAGDEITRTTSVREWLRTASLEAAEGLGQMSGMQGEMRGYMRMMNALEDRFPELIEAVEEITEGCGHVDLHWRPLHPIYSRLYIDFDRDFSVEVFHRLSDRSRDSAQAALDTVARELPKGAPFPNRPNTATGLAALDGYCLGIRVKEHVSEETGRRYRSVTLFPPDRSPIEHLSVEDALPRIVELLPSQASS